ncbi:MAG: type VI secretion system baseplate subunit TssK [Polyangia bacterium]
MSLSGKTHKPAWCEGMPLVVQSFQQWQRSVDGITELRARHHANDWGLLQIDLINNLAQGELGIRRCQASMRDGTVIDIPQSDQPCFITGLDKKLLGNDSGEVCLVLPRNRFVQRSLKPDVQRQVRYIRETLAAVEDEFGEAQPEQIEVLKHNLSLELFTGRTESSSDVDLLPIARIGRVGRRLELLPNFIPPCVSISGSDVLFDMVQRLVNRGHDRVHSLMQAIGPQVTVGQIALSPQSTHRLWVLQMLAPSMSCLTQLLETPAVHPRELYQELVRLLSALIPLYRTEMLSIPRYDHDDLFGCFSRVCRLLDELLGARDHKEFDYIDEIESRDATLWLFRARDLTFLRGCTLFLGLACERSQHELDEHFSDPKHLPMMREGDTAQDEQKAGRDGMDLVVVPASRLPDKEWVDDQAYWFQLTFDTAQSQTSWDLILRDGRISVFMPEMAKLQIRRRLLIAVRQDSL